MKKTEVLIIGAGPAGLAAALAARAAGAGEILVLERDDAPGGILQQCIHTGFGLQRFKEELTGPEYAARFIDAVAAARIPIQCDTMVLGITPERVVTAMSAAHGIETFQAGAIVLATGCRERTRGALMIPGTRPAGIYTAGTAQRFVNREGWMPGRRVVILGSGDIGLIMARRLTFQGAKVLACVEVMPFSSGLRRNLVQCLDDFGIPLMLSHTVTAIHGRERVEGVTVAAVDAARQPVPGTEQRFDCDTLLLSVGLIPENELAKTAGVPLSPVTAGAVVDDSMETGVAGIFACGNALHVHDLVDYVSAEAEQAGRAAARFAAGQGSGAASPAVKVEDGAGVRGCVPQCIRSEGSETEVTLAFRPAAVYPHAAWRIRSGEKVLAMHQARILTPGETVRAVVAREIFRGVHSVTVEVV